MDSALKDEAINKIINLSTDKVSKILIFMAGMQAQDDIEKQQPTHSTA